MHNFKYFAYLYCASNVTETFTFSIIDILGFLST